MPSACSSVRPLLRSCDIGILVSRLPSSVASAEHDAELMRRVAEGDAVAFRQLADRHLDSIVRFATRWLGRREEAEEVAQETFRREPGPSEMLFHAREALGQGQYPRLRSVLDARRPALVEHRRAIRAARDEVRQSLESEPFDPERLSQALAALRRETTSSQAVLHESLVELARGMNIEQRRRLAGLAIEDKGRSRRRPR